MVSAPPQHPALREYLLTYLGNKRALLPFSWSGFCAAARQIGTVEHFGDLFAGSEAVVMLKSLKVHKYHDQLQSVAASLLAQTVSKTQELAVRAALQRIGHGPISTSATPRARHRRTNATQRR